jgi:hypothetical protein
MATFWLFLAFFIPSIICSLFVIYHFLFNRTLRHALNNHIILVVSIIGLFYELTVYPWMLHYYQSDGIWNRGFLFCQIWAFLDYGLYITQTVLFAWATIERHILIFHDKWVSTKKKRFFVHYLPPIVLLLYCCIFYIVVDFFPPCENFPFNRTLTCAYFCFYDTYVVFMWDTIGHQILPVVTIIIFSMLLFVRILWQKHRIHQPIQWRKHRKMTVQVLSISFIYILCCFPYTLVNTMSFFDVLYAIDMNFVYIAFNLTYFVAMLLPFVCLLTLPELHMKLINILHFRQQRNRIVPALFPVAAVRNNRIHVQ